VCATAGLLVLAPWLVAKSAGVLPRALAVAVAVPLSAQLTCLPVLLLLQPQLPLYGVPANILAAPAVGPATILGVLAGLVAPQWPGLAAVLVQPASWCAEWIATVATALSDLPGAAVPWSSAAPVVGAVPVILLVLRCRAVLAAARLSRGARMEMSVRRGRL